MEEQGKSSDQESLGQPKLGSAQIGHLFNFEAEYSKSFSERTVVPPAIMENPAEVASQLTDDIWLIINGEKGSGKTSYLYFTRRELQAQSQIPGAIPLYVAFDSDDIKMEISSPEEKAHFLVTYLYKPLLREVAERMSSLQSWQRPKNTEELLTEMVTSLGISRRDIRALFPKERRNGFIAWLLRLFGIGEDEGENEDDEPHRSMVEGLRKDDPIAFQSQRRPVEYSRFRDALIRWSNSLGASRVYLLIDEVNEQRLSKSEQQILFDHLYNTYRTVKENVTIKIATTSSVVLPDFIYHGHYFMPMELSSMLLHPLGYEEMLRNILELRLDAISQENGDTKQAAEFLDFFTENSFHALAQASMGNVREFFFLSRMAYNQSLPSGRIEFSHAQRVIRNRASELEERLAERGEELNAMYLRLVTLLKARSDARQASRKRESMKSSDEAESSEQEISDTVQSTEHQEDKMGEKKGFTEGREIEGTGEEQSEGPLQSSGVSYFMISNYDSLSKEDRDLLDILEDEKAIFGTGEWKSLRRRGAKQQLYAISYLVCSLRGIKWQDVSYLARQRVASERELIDQNRCQVTL